MNTRLAIAPTCGVFALFAASSCARSSGNHPSTSAAVASPEACADVPSAERAWPSYYQAGEIDEVRPFMGEYHYIKFSEPELRGAEIVLRARAGVTKQWVARVVGCHLAYAGPFGADAAHHPDDPLLVGSPTVSFEETPTAFVIRIAGHNRTEGEEILRRARQLISASTAEQR